jgi:hypothetical protein
MKPSVHHRDDRFPEAAERRIDLSNNALDRWYAGIGVPAAALADRAPSDSRVIRNTRLAPIGTTCIINSSSYWPPTPGIPE